MKPAFEIQVVDDALTQYVVEGLRGEGSTAAASLNLGLGRSTVMMGSQRFHQPIASGHGAAYKLCRDRKGNEHDATTFQGIQLYHYSQAAHLIQPDTIFVTLIGASGDDVSLDSWHLTNHVGRQETCR
jgi:hypothetical protein